jgi:hypothetical protein
MGLGYFGASDNKILIAPFGLVKSSAQSKVERAATGVQVVSTDYRSMERNSKDFFVAGPEWLPAGDDDSAQSIGNHPDPDVQ